MADSHSLSIRHFRQASYAHLLQQQLRTAAQAGPDGAVADLLHHASPADRQQALATDDAGADLALTLTSRAIGADYGRDAATLLAILQPMTAANTSTERSIRHGGLFSLGHNRRVRDKLMQAARSVTAAALLPQFERSGLPHIARQSLWSGELPYNNFRRYFPQEALSAGEMRELCDAGRIPFPSYCREPNVRQDELATMALQKLMNRTLSFHIFTELGFALQPAQTYDAVRARVVTALQILATETANPSGDDGARRALVRNYAEDFLLDNSISFRDALPYLGFLRLDDVHLYVQAQRTDWGEWLACGQICHEDLAQGVRENFFVTEHAQQAGPHAFDLVTQLFEQERIGAASAVRLALPHWVPSKVFPSFLTQAITSFPTLDALLQGLPLPAAPGSPQTMAFFKRKHITAAYLIAFQHHVKPSHSL